MLGRLAGDVSIQVASAEIGPIVKEIRHSAAGITYELVREQDELVAPVKPALLILTVAVGFVLLIACVNVANLLLARTVARQREIAIRLALGAGRRRLIRQALIESVMLAVMGGLAGVVLAFGGINLLQGLATTLSRSDLGNGLAFPRLSEISIDLSVLAFTAGTSVITGMVFGLAPILRHSQYSPVESLKNVGDSIASSLRPDRQSRLRSVLVVAEIGMAMMLLIGGGLLVHSFMNLLSVDSGFRASNVLTFQVSLPANSYPDTRLRMFAEELVTRLQSVPSVRAAGYANQMPMVQLRDTAGGLWKTPAPAAKASPDAPDARLISREYLDVMGIRVIAGRGFGENDRDGQPRVLLINEALARHDFAGENPVGQPVYIGRDPLPWEIVGIVNDVRQFRLDRAPEPQFFVDLRQWSGTGPLFPLGAYYVVRTDNNPDVIISTVRNIIHEFDPQASLFNVAPMEQIVATTVSRPHLYAILLGIFAGIGVALAAIGIYGIIAYSVVQRTREIGIRVALGADPSDVVSLVVRQGLALTIAGIALGLSGAVAMTRYLEGVLFGVTPFDPLTFIAAAAIFLLVALLSSYLPARRASTIDPLVALRYE